MIVLSISLKAGSSGLWLSLTAQIKLAQFEAGLHTPLVAEEISHRLCLYEDSASNKSPPVCR